MIRYFISYLHQGPGGSVAGNGVLDLEGPITSMDHVQVLTEYLRQEGFNNPIVMAFQRFDDGPGSRSPRGEAR